MAAVGAGYLDVEPLVRQVQARHGGMLNKTLSAICSAEGLKRDGVKAELQARIVEQIRRYAANGDAAAFNRLKAMIQRPDSIQPTSPYGSFMNSLSPNVFPPPPVNQYSRVNGLPGQFNMGGGSNANRGPGNSHVNFKPSPFYTMEEQIGTTKACDAMSQHRNTVSISLRVSDYPNLARVVNDSSLKVKVFCCAAEGFGAQDIAFPHQCELKVNGGEIKANLRGLKNKPGTTRPVDITNDLRLKLPHYGNTVELTYALTTKKFFVSVFVVKVVGVPALVKKLEAGRRITKESVLRDMVTKARDADIVATASVLSLKCPLSTLRIDLPCRSIACRHNQCFDATSYLQLQEQGPTWLCPICNNPATFDNLAVDEYVKDILEKASKAVDQVTVEPEGVWKLNTQAESSSKARPGFGSDDDDDLVMVTKSGDNIRFGSASTGATPGPSSIVPHIKSKDQSSSSIQQSNGAINGKRPAKDIIDLTSSGDEDGRPPAKVPKRLSSGSAISPWMSQTR